MKKIAYFEMQPHQNPIVINNLIDCKSVSRIKNGKVEIISIGDMVCHDETLPDAPILKFDIYCNPNDGLVMRAVYHTVCYDIYTDINELIIKQNPTIK